MTKGKGRPRRGWCLLLAGAVLLALAACGNQAPRAGVETEAREQPSAENQNEEVTMSHMSEYEIREIDCPIGSQSIYGIAYVPKAAEKAPLVIFAHELGSTYRSGVPYAEELAARGIAVYTFDFRGGSTASRSDGQTVGMSAMTEADDVQAVLAAARGWTFVDVARIVLMGASQGGLASAIASARDPAQVSGLILLYPALLVHDAVHEQFATLDEVPERFNYNGWIMVARNYVADMWDYDVFAEMEKFEKPVLILHGNRDGIVSTAYAKQAAASYPNAELHILDGAGHGFYGSSFDKAMEYILNYLQENGDFA